MDSVDYLGANGGTVGYNLYAYCSNNPVMFSDYTGHFMEVLLSSSSGLGFQLAVSVICYLGAAIASIWDEDVRADMNNINWNPFNTDTGSASNCNAMSFYKGVPVFMMGGEAGSVSFGFIGLDKVNHKGKAEVLKHERGHNTQLMTMGLLKYVAFVGIPSPIKNGDYTPWELSASRLGGSNLSNGASAKEVVNSDKYYERACSGSVVSWWMNIWAMIKE